MSTKSRKGSAIINFDPKVEMDKSKIVKAFEFNGFDIHKYEELNHFMDFLKTKITQCDFSNDEYIAIVIIGRKSPERTFYNFDHKDVKKALFSEPKLREKQILFFYILEECTIEIDAILENPQDIALNNFYVFKTVCNDNASLNEAVDEFCRRMAEMNNKTQLDTSLESFQVPNCETKITNKLKNPVCLGPNTIQ